MIIQNNFNIGLYKILKTRQNFERDDLQKYLVSAVVADNYFQVDNNWVVGSNFVVVVVEAF